MASPRGPVGLNQLTSYKYIVVGKNIIDLKIMLKNNLENIGILGSFDPHKGHLYISTYSLKFLN